MNVIEAEDLLKLIISERGPDRARVQRLGSMEYIVILRTKGHQDYWLWSVQDYDDYMVAKTCAVCSTETSHTRACKQCLRYVCAVCRHVAGGIICNECLALAHQEIRVPALQAP
jgi:hypothetical protein